MVMCVSLLLVSALCLQLLPSAKPQEDLLVPCTAPGNSDCSGGTQVRYGSCCTMVRAQERYYMDPTSGTCRKCGPILDVSRTVPTVITSSSVVFSWELAPLSLIPVTEFVVASREEGAPLPFPNTLSSQLRSFTFLQLTENVSVTYQVRALSADGGASPVVEIQWVTGRSLAPVFRVTNVSTNESAATVNWQLETNGISPLLNYTVTLTNGPFPEGVVSNETFVLDAGEEVTDGSSFMSTYQNLLPGVMYSLQISGSNSMHFTMLPASFTFQTDAGLIPATATAGLSNSVPSHQPLSARILMCLLLFLLLHT